MHPLQSCLTHCTNAPVVELCAYCTTAEGMLGDRGDQLGTAYDMRNGGTQYAISSASFYRTNISSVVTWAIVNTSLIALVACPAVPP